MKKYIRIAVLLFVFGVAPAVTNAYSIKAFQNSFAMLVQDLLNIPTRGVAASIVSVERVPVIVSEQVPLQAPTIEEQHLAAPVSSEDRTQVSELEIGTVDYPSHVQVGDVVQFNIPIENNSNNTISTLVSLADQQKWEAETTVVLMPHSKQVVPLTLNVREGYESSNPHIFEVKVGANTQTTFTLNVESATDSNATSLTKNPLSTTKQENSSLLILSNTSTSYTRIENSTTHAAQVVFSFIVTNNGTHEAYISKDPAQSLLTSTFGSIGNSASQINYSISSPGGVIEDTEHAYTIPAGLSRSFSYYGALSDAQGKEGFKVLKINEIRYSDSPSLIPVKTITKGAEGLMIGLALGEIDQNQAMASLGTTISKEAAPVKEKVTSQATQTASLPESVPDITAFNGGLEYNVTFADVYEGVKETLQAMVTLPR